MVRGSSGSDFSLGQTRGGKGLVRELCFIRRDEGGKGGKFKWLKRMTLRKLKYTLNRKAKTLHTSLHAALKYSVNC